MSLFLDRFYKVESIATIAPQRYMVSVALVVSHPVYDGHFPGNPVVPGVCSLHMLTECAEYILGCKFFLSEAANVKFTGLVRPQDDSKLSIDIIMSDIESDIVSLKATIKSGERKVLSCNAKLTKNFDNNKQRNKI